MSEEKPTPYWPTGWTPEVQQALLAPFPDDLVEFLPRNAKDNRALALPYVEARTVMSRLDEVVGPGNWHFTFDVLDQAGKQIRGTLIVLGVTRQDAGESSNAEEESAKAAVSDALKRCAVHYGIGRYLYNLPVVWGDFDSQRRRWSQRPQIDPRDLAHAAYLAGYRGLAPAPTGRGALPAMRPPQGATPQQEAANRHAYSPEPGATAVPLAPGALICSAPNCGATLTKGQHDVSIRAFSAPLCPRHQKEHARNAT